MIEFNVPQQSPNFISGWYINEDICDGLISFFEDNEGSFFECNKNEADKALLHRFVAASAIGRFHALNENEENSALRLITNILPINGYFFSESRSIKSSLYGKGEFFSKDIYSTNHKRRFIRKDNFSEKLKHNGFQIESIIESDGLALYENDDPVVIRICAKKT